MTEKKKQPRKASWQCLDLAFKIDVGARHHAAKLVLLFLAKHVNDGMKTYHGYRSISAHTGGLTPEAIRKAIIRLKDEFKILTWESGGGSETNHYTLNLAAMKNLVRQQGVFDVETGRLLKYLHTPQPREDAPPNPEAGVTAELAPQLKVVHPPTESGTPPNPAKRNSQKSNSQIEQRSEEPAPSPFCETKQLEKVRDIVQQPHPRSAAPLPTVAVQRTNKAAETSMQIGQAIQKLDALDHGRAMKLWRRYGGEYPPEALPVIEGELMAAQAQGVESNPPAASAESGLHV